MPIAAQVGRFWRELDVTGATVKGLEVTGLSVTSTLRVSPNGNNTDGKGWKTAYTTIQAALDAASTDTDDLTLILISPHTTYYNINTTGNPTWAANVILQGAHRNWAKVMNTHASATSILKLTGKSAIADLSFNLGTGSGNGVTMTASGFRVDNTTFEGASLTGAATALWIDGSTASFGKIRGCGFNGHVTYMKGLLLDNTAESEVTSCYFHNCLTGIQIVNAASDLNLFTEIDIANCALGIDIDAGNEQRFKYITFHNNTANVDDEVGDHAWANCIGQFKITLEPADLTGTTVSTHASADTWGTDTELRAAATSTVPFRIVGIHAEPSAAGWFCVRVSDDSGSTFFDTMLFDATKREGMSAPSGTEYVFNKGTRISASAMSENGSNTVQVWLEIQEI